MKDYADQQMRLLNDISNYMLRNRDLARQREEEEERNKLAEEQASKQLQEAQEEEQAEGEQEKPEETTEETPEEEVITPDPNVEPLGNLPLANCEEKPRVEGSPSRNMKLDLSVTSLPTSTLESPAFVPECQFPVAKPVDANIGTILEDHEAEALIATPSPTTIPKEFPPSPMMSSNGHPMLAPIIDHSLIQKKLAPQCEERVQYSPNSKRKFHVSRVQESTTKPKECWTEKGDASIG
jgi:hypothetical protein